MKSIMVQPVHEFTMVEKEMPKASKGRVVIRTKYAAICGSDVMQWRTMPGVVMGHEFSGYIEDPGDSGLAKGTRVCAAEFNPCGECEFCKEGKEHLCAQMMQDNPGVSIDGAYGEYFTCRADYVHVIPDDVPMELGALTEPVAVSLHGVKYLNLKQGDDVLIWGNGPIGIYAAACAKLLGAGRVIMIGRNMGRVEFCRKFDFIDECLSTKSENFAEELKEKAPKGGFAHVIDAVGLDSYDELIQNMKSGGTIVMMGMHSEKLTLTSMPMYLKEISIRTGLYFTEEDYTEAFHMICDHKEQFLTTITSHIPHDVKAVQDMFIKLFDSGKNDECKVVIEYEG